MFHIKFKYNRSAGQTIIEAAIALSSIMIVLAAISVSITSSVNNSQFIRNQSMASKYAQQGMEYLRYIRNNDPNTFFATWGSGTYCLDAINFAANSLSSPGAQCTSIATSLTGGPFIREVILAPLSGDCSNGTRATVNVYWSSGKCPSSSRYCHKSTLISCFSQLSASGSSL